MPTETENINRIRDILMGSNLSDFEKRMIAAEQQLHNELGLMEQRIMAQLEKQQSFMDSLNEKINQAVEHQSKIHEELKTVFQHEIELLSQRLNNLQTTTDNSIQSAKKHYDEHLQSINHDLNQQTQAYFMSLKQQLYQLQSSKLDKLAISAIFSELGSKLNDSPEIDPSNQSATDSL